MFQPATSDFTNISGGNKARDELGLRGIVALTTVFRIWNCRGETKKKKCEFLRNGLLNAESRCLNNNAACLNKQ